MKRSTWIILGLLLIGFGVRVWNLAGQSFWWDEAYTVQTTRYDWATFGQLQAVARHPPLYFLTVKAWGNLAGWSEFSVRFLSVMYSVIGVALVFQLTRRIFDRRAGMAALGVAVLAPALIVYAQESRMYALVFMLAAGTLCLGYRVFVFDTRTDRFRLESVSLLICEALLLLTHYFALPFIAAFNLLALANLIYHQARANDYARWLGGQVLAALPVVLWVAALGLAQGGLAVANEARTRVGEFLRQVLVLWATGIRDLAGRWDAVFVFATALLGFLSAAALVYRRRRAVALLAFGVAALGCAFVFSSVLTSFHPRYVLMFSLPIFPLAGAALAHCFDPQRGRRWLGAASMAGVALLLVVGWRVAADPSYAKDDARSLASYLAQHAAANDVIVTEAYDYTLNYYPHGPAPLNGIMAMREPEALAELSQAISTTARVWFAHWPIATQDPRGYWPFLLEQSGTLRDWTSYPGYELYEYDLAGTLSEPVLTTTLAETGVTRWSGVEGQGADGSLTLALDWRPPVKLFSPAGTSVRLIDPAGHRVNSVDRPLVDERQQPAAAWAGGQSSILYYVLPIPPGTPPGIYTITAQLYTGRDVLSDQALGTIALPRRLDTRDPYRTLAGYQWETSSNPVNLGGLELESFALGTHAPWQPMPIDVALRWRKTDGAAAIAPRLRLAQADRVWAETGSPLFERDYPITQWAVGETVIDRLKMDYPPVRGPLELQIGQGDHWTTLTTLHLDESAMKFDLSSMQHAQSAAQFGDFAELVGYDLKAASLAVDRPLDVTLYWRATNTEPLTIPYTVFTQILAPDGHLVAQHDAPPNPPTTRWVPGQIVPDPHQVTVVDPAYRGPATLIVGWYNSASVQRVPVTTGGDYVTLNVPVRVEDK